MAERNIDYRTMERQQDDLNFRESHMDGKLNSSSSTNKTEEKPSSSQTRPKESKCCLENTLGPFGTAFPLG